MSIHAFLRAAERWRFSERISMHRDSERFCTESGCILKTEEIESLLEEGRVWHINDTVLEAHDLQDIINCTGKGDVLSFSTEKTIRPRNRLVIPWDLTVARGARQGHPLPHSANQTIITCPDRKQGIFFIR